MGTKHPDNVAPVIWRGGCEYADQMLERHWTVISQCLVCRTKLATNLRHIVAIKGREFSLWNQRPPCRVVGCQGRVQFLGKPPQRSSFMVLEAEWPPGRPARGDTGYEGPRR